MDGDNIIMATNNRSQIPSKFEFLGRDQKITQPWSFWLSELQNGLAPVGSGYVIDNTASTTGPTSISQGLAGNRGGTPTVNQLYIADDNGAIYTVSGGSWQLQSPAYTGDVLKSAFSTTTTLATVNAAPGTYGSSSTIPIITVDAKGRVTTVGLASVTSTPISGDAGDMLWLNAAGQPTATGQLFFDPATGYLNVAQRITFNDPIPTFDNLSPLTSIGDLLTVDASHNVRLPVGPDGYVLTANSAASTGLEWQPSGGAGSNPFVEMVFAFGDASPQLITTVPANKYVISCSMLITEAFNGTGATLEIGSAGTPDDIMATSDSAPSVLSTWAVNPNVKYGSATAIYLTITPGAGATTGRGLLVINIQT